jgi:hypothetical protein
VQGEGTTGAPAGGILTVQGSGSTGAPLTVFAPGGSGLALQSQLPASLDGSGKLEISGSGPTGFATPTNAELSGCNDGADLRALSCSSAGVLNVSANVTGLVTLDGGTVTANQGAPGDAGAWPVADTATEGLLAGIVDGGAPAVAADKPLHFVSALTVTDAGGGAVQFYAGSVPVTLWITAADPNNTCYLGGSGVTGATNGATLLYGATAVVRIEDLSLSYVIGCAALGVSVLQ